MRLVLFFGILLRPSKGRSDNPYKIKACLTSMRISSSGMRHAAAATDRTTADIIVPDFF